MKIIKFLTVIRQKKWWVLLLGGFINSIIFSIIFILFCLYDTNFVIILWILEFVLLIYFLSNTKFSKFIMSTFINIVTFVLIGYPLAWLMYMNIYKGIYPEIDVGQGTGASDGFGMMICIFIHIIVSVFAWIIALLMTTLSKVEDLE